MGILYFNPSKASDSKSADKRPSLYALVIGINEYDQVRPLKGAVPDAEAVQEWLERDLNVPSDQICVLHDNKASRSAILGALKNLATDVRIKTGDPILIYYAGHGGELKSPAEWESGGPDSMIQSIIPQDYNETQGQQVLAIPDRTIGALIDDIAEKKGDNITVIFDCCHSASGTRVGAKDISDYDNRSVEISIGVPANLDQGIWGSGNSRGSKIPSGFLRKGLRSHVLLAACSAKEQARELGGRGNFTKAFLNLIRSEGVDKLLYSDVLERMETIPSQNPQCEGVNQNRFFFNSKAPPVRRFSYPIHLQSSQYIMDAGAVHGVSEGAEFTIFKDQNALINSTSLGVLVASSISPFSTIMELPTTPFEISEGALALQTKTGAGDDLFLRIELNETLMPVVQALIQQVNGTEAERRKITLVKPGEGNEKGEPNLEVVTEVNQIFLNILDSRVTKFGLKRIPYPIKPNDADVSLVLRAAGHYYSHLNRTMSHAAIQTKVHIEFKLLETSKSQVDEAGYPERYPTGPNLYKDGAININVKKGDVYGLKITNNTAWDLFPTVLFFNNSDLSIIGHDSPHTAGKFKLDAPLEKECGTFTIGYGSAGGSPFDFGLDDGMDVDVGFLKVFFLTKPANLSMIPQASPFDESGRKGNFVAPNSAQETWGTILIPVVQRRLVVL